MRGILILDASCYGRLIPDDAFARFRRNVALAELTPRPSEINLLEVVQTPGKERRSALLASMERVRGEYSLLPWTFGLAKRLGEAILAGDSVVSIGDTGKEYLLEDPPEVEDERLKVLPFVDKLEASFDKLHDDARNAVQNYLKERSNERPGSARDFLENNWVIGGLRQHFAEATWSALGLPAPPPMEKLLQNEVWQLLLDAEGIGMYERAVAKEAPTRTHRLDLLQFPYLAAAPHRMLATADKPFLATATRLLQGRYRMARAVHIDDLLA
jgi:hypothetical protein